MADGHGGCRTGAGRPPGARNKRTEATIKAIEDSGLTPLDYMLSIVRDETKSEGLRLDAAKAAAPYAHHRLSSIEMDVLSHKQVDEMTPSELIEFIESAKQTMNGKEA